MTHNFQIYGFSDIGPVRKKNEDVWLAEPDRGFFALADGIGGHKAGDIAAKKTIEDLHYYVSNHFNPFYKNLSPSEIIAKIKEGIFQANNKIYLLSKEHKNMEGMGTTICMLYFFQKKAYLCHVGDSRVYLFRKQKLKQLTFDHSLVEEFRSKVSAKNDSAIPNSIKNVITRAIGITKKVSPEISSIPFHKNDIFFLCSDGLTDFVQQDEILNILTNKMSLQHSVDTLITKAKEQGSNDNITILMLKIV